MSDSDLSKTLTASDLSSTLTASDSSSTLTASETSCTLTASESSHTLTGLSTTLVHPEVFDDEEFRVPLPSTSKVEQQVQRPRRKRKFFVGDVSEEDFMTPKKGRFAFSIAKRELQEQRKALEALRKKNRRLQQKVSDLSGLLKSLREKNLISDNAQDHIEALLPGTHRDIINRIIKGSKKEKFTPSLRAFALTLHFYSPRAYNYVREKFSNVLPHPKTISKWYQTIDGNPGFTSEALSALKSKVLQSEGTELFCNLVMDEMSIRKKIEFIGGKFFGSVNFGSKTESDTLPEAKDALVFLVTSINGHWKIPVGYFLIDGLSGREKANLVLNCLELLNEINLNITSLTFDGTASNWSMANHLGADFSDHKCLKSYT